MHCYATMMKKFFLLEPDNLAVFKLQISPLAEITLSETSARFSHLPDEMLFFVFCWIPYGFIQACQPVKHPTKNLSGFYMQVWELNYFVFLPFRIFS